MQIEYNSDWLDFTIELIKCFGEIKQTIRNEEMGSITLKGKEIPVNIYSVDLQL